MCNPHRSGCFGCVHGLDRRAFLAGCGGAGAALACGAIVPSPSQAQEPKRAPVRVAVVFLSNSDQREIWPYPGFNCEARHAEVLQLLRAECTGIEFVPFVVRQPADVQKTIASKASTDGLLVYIVTLNWELTATLAELGKLGKPMLVADEFLGGCGVFLTGTSALARRGIPVAAVSSTRPADLVAQARLFAGVKAEGATAASFARQCDEAARRAFARAGKLECREDRLTVAPIDECLKRLKQSRFLVVGAGEPGSRREYLGATGLFVGFNELTALYDQVDRDQAADWAKKWSVRAEKVVEASPEWIHKAAALYLAMLALMKKHGTDSITMNCLGGFAAGKLPAYPCLGFMQILDDGGQGVCEAMPDDSVSTLLGRFLTGRAGYVSDPALDTSKNQIVYAHCMALTKVFGPGGPSNPFRIRTLHNRDPRGCCAESLLPQGYMTTTFRTNVAQQKLVLHQAKAVGNLQADRGCRTQLVGEVCGDIGKLFGQWDVFGWHRVTVYGDLKDPLIELAKALRLEVVAEA